MLLPFSLKRRISKNRNILSLETNGSRVTQPPLLLLEGKFNPYPFHKQRLTLYSDTTAPTFAFIFYCLAKYPEHTEKIYEEVKNIDTLDIATVTALPHLNGVINEAMRLHPVLLTGISRLTPPEGVMFGDTFVPGSTKLLLPACVISKRKSLLLIPHTDGIR